MNPEHELLLELEEPIRLNLYRYLRRELESEYQAKHRNKALKLGVSALEGLQLRGEQLKVHVREAGKVFRVDMTFPLFDLDSDFTLIQCSCLREAISFEALRCHHMYLFQLRLVEWLDQIESQRATASCPIEVLESFWPEAAAPESLLYEEQWALRLNRETWQLSFERRLKARYEPQGTWQSQERLDFDAWKSLVLNDKAPSLEAWRMALLRGGGEPERELYEILLMLADTGPATTAELLDAQTSQALQLISTNWHIKIEELSAGYNLRPVVGALALPIGRLIAGRGLVAWTTSEPLQLYLVPLEAKVEAFVQKLLQLDSPIPLAAQQRMLELLQRLDPRLLDLSRQGGVQDQEPARAVASMQGLLRLTPFVRGGMKVELLLQIAPQLVVRAGEGPELLRQLPSVPSQEDSSWQRDFPAERRLVRRLSRLLDLEILPEPESGIFIAYNDSMALDLMQRIEMAKQQDEALILEWPEALRRGPPPYELATGLEKAALKVSIGEKKDWFQVEGWLELDEGTKIDLRELLAAVRQQQKYIRLPDGRWAMVSEHFRQRLQPLVSASEDDGEDCTIDLSGLEQQETLAALAAFPFEAASKRFWHLVHKAREARTTAITLPLGLQAKLRPYQLDGYRWMHHLYEVGLGACLADDMGLGKTVQTLSLLLKKAEQGPSLVIAPSSLAYNWTAEARRFCPDLRLTLLRELEDRGQNRSFQAGEVVIASYGLVLRYAVHLSAVPWNIIVLDEAQMIKNAQTQTAQAVQTLQARWILALSGTPIENRLSELWSLFRTLSPGLFGEWERFRSSYVFPIERDRSAAAQQRLQKKLAPFVLRRLKKDYLTELPDKTEIDLWIDLSEDERQFYDALRGEAISKIQALETAEAEPAQQAKQRMQVLAALTRLRQAACHRQLVDPSWNGTATKVELLREHLAQLSEAGHAALVFSQFTRLLRLLEAALLADGRKILYLDGQTPVQERQQLVDKFQAGGTDAFLISLKAGGTGLNLTRASYVFHMDPWWNPAVEQQATDRAYRMGQKQAVTVYKLRARQTIEELIHAIHGEKRELMETLLAGRDPQQAWSWDAVWSMLQGKSEEKTGKELPRVQNPGPFEEGTRL